MPTLLLIDTSVRMYQEIADAAKPTTAIILFDSVTSSLDDVVGQVKGLPAHTYTSVGLVQDGTNMMASYRIVQSQPPCELMGLEKDGLSSWSPVVEFLQSLKTLTGMTTFDFVSCLLDANEGFAYAITQISNQIGVTLQASKDLTGNLAEGGNWTQESSGVNIQDVYFTDAISQFTGSLYYNVDRYTSQMITANNPTYSMVFSNNPDSAMVKANTPSGIAAWGNSSYGGSGAPTNDGKAYTAIVGNTYAFAALDTNGTITAWGNSSYGGSGAPTNDGKVYTAIVGNTYAFAALDTNGSITAWGDSSYGGSGTPPSTNGKIYTAIASTNGAFAALDTNGSITAWGNSSYGGSGAPPSTNGKIYTAIAATSYAFAALDTNGAITAWGYTIYGGSGAPSGTGYTAISSTNGAFAALDTNGRITVWGYANYGGSGAPPSTNGKVYTVIVGNPYAFAALDTNGAIFAWGSLAYGGSGAPPSTNGKVYTAIAATSYAFAALDTNGAITAWGETNNGGSGAPPSTNGKVYTAIVSADRVFAALDTNGSIFLWGNAAYGGSGAPLSTNGKVYTTIKSTGGAFAALDTNGSITGWGNANFGGSGAPPNTNGKVYTAIASSYRAFASFYNIAWTVTAPTMTWSSLPTLTFGSAYTFPSAANQTNGPQSNSRGSISYAIDTQQPNNAGASINSSGVLTVSGAGTFGVSATQAAAGNYSSGIVTAVLTVNPVAPTLTWSLSAKTFGVGDYQVTPPTSNSSGTFSYVSSDSTVATITSSGSISIKKVGTATITATQAANGNYSSVTVPAVLTVDPVAPTLTWSLPAKTFDTDDFTVSAPSSPNFSGSFSYTSSDPTVATIDGTIGKISIKKIGTTTITATQAASGNYSSATVTAVLTVNPAAPTLTWSLPTKTFGNGDFTVAPPTSNSSGTFSYVSSNTGVATVTGSTIHIVSAGNTTITATQAAAGNYTSKTVAAPLTVNPVGAPSLVVTLPQKTFVNTNFTINPVSNSSGVFSYFSSDATVATVTSLGVVTTKKAGTTMITVTQAAAGAYISGTVTAQLTVSNLLPSIIWGDPAISGLTQIIGTAFALPGATSASKGAVTYTAKNDIVSLPGVVANFVKNGTGNTVTFNQIGTITITATQAAAGNYDAAVATKTFTVNGPPSFEYPSLSTTKPSEGQYFTLTGYGTDKLAVFTTESSGLNFVQAVTNAKTNNCTTLVVQYKVGTTNKYVVCSIGTTGIHTVSGNDNATSPNTHSVSLTVPTGTTLVLGPQFTRPTATPTTLNVNIFVRTITSTGSIDTKQVTSGEIVTAADSTGIAKVQIQRYSGNGSANPLSWTAAGIGLTSGAKTYSPASTAVNTIAISLPGQ